MEKFELKIIFRHCVHVPSFSYYHHEIGSSIFKRPRKNGPFLTKILVFGFSKNNNQCGFAHESVITIKYAWILAKVK